MNLINPILQAEVYEIANETGACTMYFPIKSVPKGRPRFEGKGKRPHTPDKTRKFESDIRRAAEEYLKDFDPGELSGRLGARIYFLTPSKVGDLDNHIKAILDALQTVMFGDDRQFDYLEVLRIVNPAHKTGGIYVTLLKL